MFVLTNHFPFPPPNFGHILFMCTFKDPTFIACMCPLWQAGHSLLLITFFIPVSPWLELKLYHNFAIFSAHICVHRIPFAMPQFLMVRNQYFYADLIQDPVVKLTNQGQAKCGDLGDQHYPNILVPL